MFVGLDTLHFSLHLPSIPQTHILIGPFCCLSIFSSLAVHLSSSSLDCLCESASSHPFRLNSEVAISWRECREVTSFKCRLVCMLCYHARTERQLPKLQAFNSSSFLYLASWWFLTCLKISEGELTPPKKFFVPQTRMHAHTQTNNTKITDKVSLFQLLFLDSLLCLLVFSCLNPRVGKKNKITWSDRFWPTPPLSQIILSHETQFKQHITLTLVHLKRRSERCAGVMAVVVGKYEEAVHTVHRIAAAVISVGLTFTWFPANL